MSSRKNAAACAAAAFILLSNPASAANPIPLETYLKLTDVAWASPSSDGSRIAYTGRESGTWQVWVTDANGLGKPRPLTNGKDATDFAQWVPGDAHTILYASSRGGSGVDQFYYVRDDRPGSVALLPKETNVTHTFGAFSPDGERIAFSSNRRKEQDFDVYILDRRTGTTRRVFTVEGTAYATSWSPDSKKLLVQLVRTPYNADLYVVDLKTLNARLITKHTGDANFDSSQFDGEDKVLCISDLQREFHSIVRIDIATGAMKSVLDVPSDIDQVMLSPDRRVMAYIVNSEGYGDVVIADPQTGREIERPKMPPSIAESLLFTPNGNLLVYSASAPTFPKVTFTYNLQTRVTTQVIKPNFHAIPPSSIVEPALVHVRSFDGRSIPAWYFRPTNAKGKLTVLLDIHGGPEEQDRVWFYPFAQYLVSRGYGLLDPNVRGSTGYGRTYLHLADERKRENAVKDVKALRDWLAASGDANPNGIFVNGASYGGYVVLSSLYNYPQAYAGGVDVYGVADWISFLQKTGENRANREAVYGSLAHDRGFLASISPINHVSQIKRPVLIIAGKNDTIVPVSQSIKMAQALRNQGVPVQLHVFPNEGHGVSNVQDLITIYQLTLSFMQRYSGNPAAFMPQRASRSARRP